MKKALGLLRAGPLLGLAGLCAALACVGLASAAEGKATAELIDSSGEQVGSVDLSETPHGVWLKISLDGLAPGSHAFHIHETGVCEAPFKTAGGHFNPTGASHGMLSHQGMHAGDLPNIHSDGAAQQIEILAAAVTLAPGKPNSLFDADGSAIVIHAAGDDYISDPAGNAGDRIVCGVITPQN